MKSRILKTAALVFAVLLLKSSLSLTSCSDNGSVLVTKSSSHILLRTVHPGDEITYTFTFENESIFNKKINVTDIVPSLTLYIDGDFENDGDDLSLTVTVPRKTTLTRSYTVSVCGALGDEIVSPDAEINGEPLSADTLLIARTLNETDRAKFTKAVKALKDSDFEGVELLSFMYSVAFSTSSGISDTAGEILNQIFISGEDESRKGYHKMLVPSLYGGKALGITRSITLADIAPGDVLCILPYSLEIEGGRFFVSDGAKLYDITQKCTEVDDDFLDNISNNEYFAVIRPSMAMQSDLAIRSEPISAGETDVEKAIIATAEAFLMRGARTQYADTRLVQNPIEYRWERGKTPEDYTLDETGYTNCTGFVHDVYYAALGWDYGPFYLANAPDDMQAYSYDLTHEETDEEKAFIEKVYKSQLRIGDVVFYTITGNTHAMLYVGGGNLIHCTGSTYRDLREADEPAIRYMKLDELFDEQSSRSIFSKRVPRETIYIIRPLNMYSGEVPESSLMRIGDMRDVFAEKTCSATLGQTVNAGDSITYTFTVENRGDKTVAVDIADEVPEFTALSDGGERTLKWTLELLPNERKQVSYTVTVSENAKSGTAISCSDESKVGGIPTKAPPVYVGRTLNTDEQVAIRAAIESRIGSKLSALEIVNEVYEEVLGVENVFPSDVKALESAIFTEARHNYALSETSTLVNAVAPSLYGGKNVLTSDRFMRERTRLPSEKNLIVGDVIYIGIANDAPAMYIYAGDGALYALTNSLDKSKLSARLESTIGHQAFAILRPSLICE